MCTSVWNDDKFPFVSDDCKLVWFHVFTNPISSAIGCFKMSIAGLADEMNRSGAWPYERYAKAFQEAIDHGFMRYDPRAMLVWFPRFFEFACNAPNLPNVLKHWGKYWRELPQSPLKDECFDALHLLVVTMHEGFQEAFRQSFVAFHEKHRQRLTQRHRQTLMVPEGGKGKEERGISKEGVIEIHGQETLGLPPRVEPEQASTDPPPTTPPPVESLKPEWLPVDMWEAFKKMRKKIKKPMTEDAERLIIERLGRLRDAGEPPRGVLAQSVENSWQGVFPIKREFRRPAPADTSSRRVMPSADKLAIYAQAGVIEDDPEEPAGDDK